MTRYGGRRRGLAAAAAGTVLLALGAGCGGSDLFGFDDGVEICSAGTFSPSYAEQVELARFRDLPVTVAFANRVTYGETDLQSVVTAGFTEWAEATGGVLGYRLVSDPDDAQVVVTINVLDARPTAGGELGSATVTRTDRRIEEVTIRLDVWDGMSPAEVFQGLRSTAAHEFGHALGILDHSDNVNDVMYPSQPTDRRTPVSQRDVNTAKTAYCTEFGRAAGAPPCAAGQDCGAARRGRGSTVRETVCGAPRESADVSAAAAAAATAADRALRLP